MSTGSARSLALDLFDFSALKTTILLWVRMILELLGTRLV